MNKQLAIFSAAATLGLAAFHQAASAQTVMAFKTGEQTTGMTKQCYYEALGNSYARTVSSVSLCPLSIQVPTVPSVQAPAAPTYTQQPRTITAFKTGEQTTGMTKQCFYDALGSSYTRTVSSVSLCPLSIQVRN